ncbi:MAG TPA: hypothetical protein VMX13_13830 [Sedimentisphaerales bacterium]|nr:hypothetical protein [Sedimentisphaerales bacterium]
MRQTNGGQVMLDTRSWMLDAWYSMLGASAFAEAGADKRCLMLPPSLKLRRTSDGRLYSREL